MNDDNLVAHIYNELDRATDYANTALRENRAKAWNYYLNRPRGDEREGRSTVQDTSVRDTVHALLAQIMPAYSTDNLIKFEPAGAGDIRPASAESAAVNNLFTEDNQGYTELHSAVTSALLFRNGVIKVWVDDVLDESTRRFNATPSEVEAAQTPGPNDSLDFVEYNEEEGYSVFRITRKVQKLHTKAVELARLYVDPNQENQQLQDCSFIGELDYLPRSDLIAMGVSKTVAMELPASQDESQTSTGSSNADLMAKYVDGQVGLSGNTTPDRELVECYWVHMKVDRNGDGMSERYRFLVANRQILLDDPVDFFPYASGTAWPVPHRWSGLSVYDLERITQDERTNARRQLADNLNTANNQRPVFDPSMTNPEDITNSAPGRGIRSKDPGGVSFVPVTDITSNSISFLAYMDKVRSEQTGAALEMSTGEGQLVREASGVSVDMQMQPREMVAAQVARNLAETLVRNLFLLIHQTLRRDWIGSITYQLAGDWQDTEPSEWRPRKRLNVTVGLSPGERRRSAQALQYVHQVQMQMIQGGSANITTSWAGVHQALQDWMRGAELDGAEGYFLDPLGQESQAGQQAAGEQQEAQQQQQAELMAKAEQLEVAKFELESKKLELDKYKAEIDIQFKYWQAQLNAGIEVDKIDQAERQGTGKGGTDTDTSTAAS
jgi:hypothetical protein